MRRIDLITFCAKAAAAVSLCVTAARAEADGRLRPVFIRSAPVLAPVPRYYQRYFGPSMGTYGSPAYGITRRRISFDGPRVYAPWGYGSVGGFGYVPFAPTAGIGALPTYGPPRWGFYEFNPYANPVLQGTLIENELRWGMNMPAAAPSFRPRVKLRPSTPQQQVKSIHAQAEGDVWMRKLRFLNAYERYRVAINAANDRPEPYFRMAFALAAVGSFDSAVKYIKQGLDIDPQWPAHGDRLDTIFGEDNRLAVLSMIEHVSGWVRDDIRDPDRLFLIGVILHFDGDTRADQFFEAAYRLAGTGDHLLSFLQPQAGPNSSPGRPQQSGAPAGPQTIAPFAPSQAPGLSDGPSPPPEPMEPQVPPGSPSASPTPRVPFPGNHGPALSPRLIQPNPGARPDSSGGRTKPLGPIPPSLFEGRKNLPPVAAPKTAPPTNPAPPTAGPGRPASPALPLPPLPSPADSSTDSGGSSQSNPADGPALFVPTAGVDSSGRFSP